MLEYGQMRAKHWDYGNDGNENLTKNKKQALLTRDEKITVRLGREK